MLRSTFAASPTIRTFIQHKFQRKLAQSAATAKPKWDIYAGIQLERLPVVTKTLTKIEQDYKQLLNQIEFENSHKSTFEIQHETDLKMAELIKTGRIQVDIDATTKATAQDNMDMWNEAVAKFQFGSRLTEADKKGDLRSTNRKLEEPLILVKEHAIGKDKIFLLPQGKHIAGETLRETAERVLKELCGESTNVLFYGNAPCGFYKYKYPKNVRQESIGAKVFFFRAAYRGGKIDSQTGDFAWLDKDELLKKVEQYKDYHKSVQSIIL